MPMLSQPEPNAATVPPVSEVLELMSEYLDTLGRVEMLAECLSSPSAAVVSMTRRMTLNASQSARVHLECARSALAMAGNFTRAVPLGAGMNRPVDLTRNALEHLELARRHAERHHAAETTTAEEREAFGPLCEWVTHATEDLGAMLSPVCELLGSARP